ncbi:hypothetical protein MUK42_32925 [Musa troglodytarum]|uniref:Uncharacterized protein n=1 Tax=Musa troglodytarum TaxID=320322 RepID=A0A9E7FGV8_9LILI|nr:hypothetical protein MUK42_32925 [Musa troglodytarum]
MGFQSKTPPWLKTGEGSTGSVSVTSSATPQDSLSCENKMRFSSTARGNLAVQLRKILSLNMHK